MSETTSYSSVSSVESVGTASAASGPGLAELIGGLFVLTATGLIAAAAAARSQLDSPTAVHASLAGRRRSVTATTTAAARKLALSGLQGMVVPEAGRPKVERLLVDLREAASLPDVHRAQAALEREVQAQHAAAFAAAIANTCARAAIRLNYTNIAVECIAVGVQRVFARNAEGHALVSEVRTAASGEVSLETEVFGTKDPECGRVMAAHDEALRAEGLRGGSPRRRKTGGVAQLLATIDHLPELLRLPRKPRTATTPIRSNSATIPATPDRQRQAASPRLRTRG